MTIEVNETEDFHVVLNGNVVALSLNALDMAYQDDLISDETLIWQEGFAEWTRLDVLLAALEQQEGPVAPAPPSDPDTYFVLVAPEEVKQMSLDLLSDAYRLDVIDDDTLVWQPGYTEWIPLSVLLGAPEEHVSLAPSLPAPLPVASAFPASRPMGAALPAPSLPAPSLPPSMGYGAGPSSVPANSAAYSAPPYTASLHASAPASSRLPAHNTYMPQAFEVPELRPRISPWYGRGLIAVAALGMLVVAHRNGLTQSTAETLNQTASLGEIEGKLGGPGIDTNHGLQQWLGKTSERYQLDDLSETQPVPQVAAGQASAAEPSSAPSASDLDAKKVLEEKSADGATATDSASKKSESDTQASPKAPVAAASFASSLSGKPAAAPAKSYKPKSTYRAPASSKRKAGAGDPNDPMNGDL